jgi:hypothetical protein
LIALRALPLAGILMALLFVLRFGAERFPFSFAGRGSFFILSRVVNCPVRSQNLASRAISHRMGLLSVTSQQSKHRNQTIAQEVFKAAVPGDEK